MDFAATLFDDQPSEEIVTVAEGGQRGRFSTGDRRIENCISCGEGEGPCEDEKGLYGKILINGSKLEVFYKLNYFQFKLK